MTFENFRQSASWLIDASEFEAAKTLAQTVSAHFGSEHIEALDFMAEVHYKCADYPSALEVSRKISQVAPHFSPAKIKAARSLTFLGYPEEAQDILSEMLLKDPRSPEVAIDLALAYSVQGRFDEALKIYENLLKTLAPTDSNWKIVTYNRAWLYIRDGQLLEGMSGLHVGRELKFWGTIRKAPKPPMPSGFNVKGKTIVLCGEGGIGDEIINARFGQEIERRGGKALWISANGLGSLFQRTPGLNRSLEKDQAPFISYDEWIPCMDIPYALQLDLKDVHSEPYIKPLPEYIKKFGRLVKSPHRLKVGLRWHGNPRYQSDPLRSVPFSIIERLAGLENVDFYSLQKDRGKDELARSPSIIDWGPELHSWEDTAGAVANLDLVISSCTSVPHLVAAMGKPTWLFCPLFSYYIWASPGERSPWYRSIRLFRQKKIRSWEEPFEEMYSRLKNFDL